MSRRVAKCAGRLTWIPSPAISKQQQSDTSGYCYPSVNRPSRLASHETARQHVDTLQKPDGAEQDKDGTCDVQRDFHWPIILPWRLRFSHLASGGALTRVAVAAFDAKATATLGPALCD